MARPKTFDEDRVLTHAMNCFWLRGYSATSMKNLEKATTLKTSSLYNAFKSKDGLFLKSLDHYIEKVAMQRIKLHLESDDPIVGIQRYFSHCFKDENAMKTGCLLINTSAELPIHTEATRLKVAQGIKIVETGLCRALKRAQKSGQLPMDVDPQVRALHLGLLLSGMLVTGKTTKNKKWLKEAMVSVNSLLH